MPDARFTFGRNNEHEVLIKCGWIGSEKYYVDGVLVQSSWNPSMNSVRRFEAHGHDIEVRVNVDMEGATGVATVDGHLVADDLFKEFNDMLKRPPSARAWKISSLTFLFGALVFFFFLVFRDALTRP